MPKNLHPKQKDNSLPISELIDMGSPDLYYSVQQAFQNAGILLIDLYSGDVIEGQVNIPNIGLILGTKTATTKRKMGFVQSESPNHTEFSKRDIDAVLIFDEKMQRPGSPLNLIIQVVDFDEMPIWAQISIQIARQFIIKEAGNRLSEVFFSISSLSRSNGINDSARNAALHDIRGYSLDGADSVSNTPIPEDRLSDDDDGDDEFEFKKRGK